jgi:hypothetical protein
VSLAIAFKGPEGVVLAVDSRVTLTTHLEASGRFTSHFDNASKLFAIEGQPYVGIATYGAGAIGHAEPRTAHSFIPEFEAELSATYSDRATVQQIAQAVSDFYHDQWQQRGMPADADPMVFLVAGFDDGEPYGKVYQVSIPNSLVPVEQSPSGFGVTFGGQAELAARLLGGVDVRAADLAKDALGLDDTQRDALAECWRAELSLAVPYQFLPLQDCVDLSTFLVEMTSTVQGWTVGVRGVGGAVDVATITRIHGLQAIQQKMVHVND